MRTIKHLPFLVFMMMLLVTACNKSFTKKGYLNNYDRWINTLKNDYENFNEADWDHATKEFLNYSETEYDRFKEDLTPEEHRKIDQIAGQFFALVAKSKVKQVKSKLNSIFNKAKGMFEELQKE